MPEAIEICSFRRGTMLDQRRPQAGDDRESRQARETTLTHDCVLHPRDAGGDRLGGGRLGGPRAGRSLPSQSGTEATEAIEGSGVPALQEPTPTDPEVAEELPIGNSIGQKPGNFSKGSSNRRYKERPGSIPTCT